MASQTPEQKVAIGIDLGTSKCCVGVVINNRVEILENDLGSRTTPSCVAFTDTRRLVGEAALWQAAKNATNTISGVKRFMGKEMNKYPAQASYIKGSHNTVDVFGQTGFKVTYKKEERVLLPQQISAMLLSKMKAVAENYLGHEVKDAVISVPASFTNAQRQATGEAASISGLNVLALINEPTAAALNYQHNRSTRGEETIAVVDFGAGKLDVAIVTLDDYYLGVRTGIGNTEVGGDDVDMILTEHVSEKLSDTTKQTPLLDLATKERLRVSCENFKKKFACLSKVEQNFDCVGGETSLAIEMSKDDFDDKVKNKLHGSVEACLKESLRNEEVDHPEIDRVLLVGGSTRILAFQTWLEDFFPGRKLEKSVNVDEAVAYGAALHACSLLNNIKRATAPENEARGRSFFLKKEGTEETPCKVGQTFAVPDPAQQPSGGAVSQPSEVYSVFEKNNAVEEIIARVRSGQQLTLQVDEWGVVRVEASASYLSFSGMTTIASYFSPGSWFDFIWGQNNNSELISNYPQENLTLKQLKKCMEIGQGFIADQKEDIDQTERTMGAFGKQSLSPVS